MNRILAGLATLAFLAVAVPALAQGRDDRDHDHGHMEMHHGGPPMRHYAPPPRRHMHHEGEVWNGHHVTYRGGHWGYYQPRNGVQLFVNIPL